MIGLQTLPEYLQDVVDLQSKPDGNAAAVVDEEAIVFLSGIYVMKPPQLFNPSSGDFKPPEDVSNTAHSTQSHVVNRVIKMILFHSDPARQTDLLVQGYRRISSNTNASLEDVHGIENYFPNTIVNSLKSKHWQWLLSRIGDHLMQHLLLNTVMFQKLCNGCLMQLNGVPLSNETFELIYSKPERKINGISPANNAIRKSNVINNQCTVKRLVNRQRMFFDRTPGYIGFRTGLPRTHPLNKACKELSAKDNARQVLVQIFSLQFYTTKKRKRKSRWRLKQVIPLIHRLMLKHSTFDFVRCLKKFCPVSFVDYQMKENVEDTNLLNCFSRYHQVFSFLRCVLQKVFPKAFWGCKENFDCILRMLKQFIGLRKFETLSQECLMRNFKLMKCKWLAPADGHRVSNPTDLSKRHQLAGEFIFWLFQSYIVPLLRNTFYITDSSSHRNRMFYYRHDLWSAITQPELQKFCRTIFGRVNQREVQDILRNPRIGYSQLRLIPKESGLRPIINLRKRLPLRSARGSKAVYLPSVNTTLQNAFQILNHEKSLRPELMGASVLGVNEIHQRIKGFRSIVAERRSKDPLARLYFAKTDVRCAFDNVNQQKLLEILEEILSEKDYIVYKYASLFRAGQKIKWQMIRRAMDSGEFPQFPELARKMSEQMISSIITDQVLYNYEGGQDMLELIEDHVRNNLIKVGKGLYRQVVGIPQGSVLSTLLCSLFYGRFEAECLAELNLNEDGLLLRFVDDFLLITFSKTKARDFLGVMHTGNPAFGCFVNPDKSLVNFDCPPIFGYTPKELGENAGFPWCGLVIDPRTLDLGYDNSRYFGCRKSNCCVAVQFYVKSLKDLSDTMTSERSIGRTVVSKVVFFLKYRLYPLYLDTSMNSQLRVMSNIMETFVISAMKFHLAISNLNFTNNHQFQIKSMEEIIRAAWAIMRSKITGIAGKQSGAQLNIHSQEVLWLGYEAFKLVLSRKQAAYTPVLSYISEEMEALKVKLKRISLLMQASQMVKAAKLQERIQF